MHRIEIDKRLAAGEASRGISAWLASQGEKINYVSLTRHKQGHADPVDRAKQILTGRVSAPVERAAEKIVADADLLDELAGAAVHVARTLRDSIALDPSTAMVHLFNGALREAREAVVAKAEILNGKKVNVDATISGGLAALFAGVGLEESEDSEPIPE